LSGIVFVVLAIVLVVGGMGGMVLAWMYADLKEGLPAVEEVETIFSTVGGSVYQPVRIYDRSGEIIILEVLHPDAATQRWHYLDPLAQNALPHQIVQATVVALDGTFWRNPGYDLTVLAQSAIGLLLRRPALDPRRTIGEQFAAEQLIPLTDDDVAPLTNQLRVALLSADLSRNYSKEQILEWFLNSANYGNHAYGIDAAALVYFGKHANQLTLAEATLLAGVPREPSQNPIDEPEAAKELQAQVLEGMVQLGMIRQSEADLALKQPINVLSENALTPSWNVDFTSYVLDRIETSLHSTALHRSGLQVITTLDHDLQLQADCVARSHLLRMSGDDAGAIEPAQDGSACIAAGLLPPLRPSDTGVDHAISDVGLVVIDPTTGHVLSLIGAVDVARPAGSLMMPLIYLTAFSRGYSPGTMVLDVPMLDGSLGEVAWEVPANEDGQSHGPVRMRTALANSYYAAAARTLSLGGVENVIPTLRTMGLSIPDNLEEDYGVLLASGRFPTTLIEMAYAHSVIANQGRMVGITSEHEAVSQAVEVLTPLVIQRIEDHAGRVIYAYQEEERAVLSRPLAFLMADVLSDEAARWPAYGRSNPLEVRQPAGAKIGTQDEDRDNWTVGFTPSIVVAVWVGNLERGQMDNVHALNGAAPIWHAVTRYATREQPSLGWSSPPGVSTMEVCDPSGLLPTQYCPIIVREVFIHGTEPTQYDNLYQPFLINRETGKLATLNTPIELVEEKVFFMPPPEALEWALDMSIEQPPNEYDTLYEEQAVNPQVNILSPETFDVLRGQVTITGNANPETFAYYRLQYGRGLNPIRWIQIGEDRSTPMSNSVLGRWTTTDLEGLYTLQLVVVQTDGRIATAAVHVTLDNQPPSITLLTPEEGNTYSWPSDQEVVIEVEVIDSVEVAKVVFYVDDRPIKTLSGPPYSTRWRLGLVGEHEIYAIAFDGAGNEAESQRVEITVTR
jgi:membrane carboxypeptidase/penicillin-binding protein